MDTAVEITPGQARYLALSSQGLTCQHPFGRGLSAVVSAIKRLGYVQIDTISVVQRAHHHVLWSRIPTYDPGCQKTPSHLDQLLNQPQGVFEYWSHAAAFLPISEYRYSLIRKQRLRSGANLWFHRDDAIIRHVLKRITNEGPLSSRDFKNNTPSGASGWWDWKPAKKALEQLFLDGTLMVSARQGFQKTFDLTERVLPPDIDRSVPSISEFARWLITTMLRAHGLATLTEISYWAPRLKPPIQKALVDMQNAGIVVSGRVKGHSKQQYYLLTETWDEMRKPVYDRRMRILNPFDNTVIQRKRLEQLFGFKYVLECYVPSKKRKLGYFCLPLLWRDRFPGVIDCKVHRRSGKLEVKSLHFLDQKPLSGFKDKLAESLSRYIAFNLP